MCNRSKAMLSDCRGLHDDPPVQLVLEQVLHADALFISSDMNNERPVIWTINMLVLLYGQHTFGPDGVLWSRFRLN